MAGPPAAGGREWEEKVDKTLFGNGEPGLDERMRSVERVMFINPNTGEKGLIHTVQSLTATVEEFKTGVRTLGQLMRTLITLISIFGGGSGLVGLFVWLSR